MHVLGSKPADHEQAERQDKHEHHSKIKSLTQAFLSPLNDTKQTMYPSKDLVTLATDNGVFKAGLQRMCEAEPAGDPW
jgi:hypothetical protein